MKNIFFIISFFFLTLAISVNQKLINNREKLPGEVKQSENTTAQPTLKLSLPAKNISLDSIISKQDIEEFDLKILVTGDINLGRSVNSNLISSIDSDYPFSKTFKLLSEANITLVNLESPLKKDCPILNTVMKFCAEKISVERLAKAGIDFVSLANNHINDQGKDGIKSTENALLQSGIHFVNQGKFQMIERNGISVGVVGFDLIWHRVKEEELIASIKTLSNKVDIVIAIFHWGNEYTYNPNKQQREFAKLAIDSGANLVIGNHPHWIQALEIYKNRLIAYSHGNFVFDQLWSTETREGIIGEYYFKNNELAAVNYFPIWIGDDYQPELLSGERSDKIIQKLKKISEDLLNEKPITNIHQNNYN